MSVSSGISATALQGANQRLRNTLGNEQWLRAHKHELLQQLPQDWVSAADPSFQLRFGFGIKCLGVEWRELSDVVIAMMWLQRLGWADARRDPHAAPGNPAALLIRRARP